jgi:hypothetical protein
MCIRKVNLFKRDSNSKIQFLSFIKKYFTFMKSQQSKIFKEKRHFKICYILVFVWKKVTSNRKITSAIDCITDMLMMQLLGGHLQINEFINRQKTYKKNCQGGKKYKSIRSCFKNKRDSNF